MHLIFIRHGDPDYVNDSVTEKGQREIAALAERARNWKVNEMFVSPLGRAQKTAEGIIPSLNCNVTTEKWLQEFYYKIKDPVTKKDRIVWDWLPQDFVSEPKFKDIQKWHSLKCMKEGNIPGYYSQVCQGIDTILEGYDYARIDQDKALYNCFPHLTKEEAVQQDINHINAQQKEIDDVNLVFVCHLGVMFAIISHLTGISPVQLWQQFFVAPTSVTILGTEERVPGTVSFRIQTMGDVSHLYKAGEPVSASGFFGNCISW